MTVNFGAPLTVTPVVTALLVFLMVGLGLRISRLRGLNQVKFGDGGISALKTLPRAYGNLVEHALPLLLLLLLWELEGAARTGLILMGTAIIVARVVHLIGFAKSIRALHFGGAALTYLLEAALAVCVVVQRFFT